MCFSKKPFIVFRTPERTLLLLLLILVTSAIKAQPPPLVFRNFNVNDGLSHNFVRGFLQDSRGFMWVATIDGLNKFDGYTFKTYKARHDDPTSLSSNNVSTLAEDSDGNIWVGTWGGGICIYDRKSDRFKRVPYSEGTENNALSSKFVYVSYKDSKNRIWLGTSDQGLFLADPATVSFTQFAHDPSKPSSLSHNGVHAITEDDKGRLWIGTLGGGLNHFNPETKEFTIYVHKENDQQSLSTNIVTQVFFDTKKRLWVGTSNNTLSLSLNSDGKFRHFRNRPNDAKSLLDYHVTAIQENDGKIWIGTDFGLSLFNEKDSNFHHYRSRPFDRKGLASNQIKTVYADREGRLWIGSYNGGVSMFDESFVRILHYYTYLNENSLSFNDVSAFLQNDDGTILVGTDGGGLNVFDRNTSTFAHYRHDPTNTRSIGSNYVKTILRTSTGKIWLGLWGSGITTFDVKKKVFIPFEEYNTGAEGSIGEANVTCLTEDADGVVWACTWGNGVYKLSQDKSSVRNFVLDMNDTTSVSNLNAWAIYADSKNNIWVGNSDGILDLYDRVNERFIHFRTTPPGKNSTGILVIAEDSKGRIWVGLEGGGLKLLDRKNRRFKSYDIETGLPSDYVNSIEEDQHGNLWIGTNNGICRFDPETGKTRNYDVNYGLQSLQFNRQSSMQLKSGEMMFGGVNGFNIFHPDSLTESAEMFPIAFTGFQVFNKNVPIASEGSPLSQHINETSEITLPYHSSVFSLEYAALNFMGPENVRYKYRLKGFVNEDWQDVGVERKVTYTNLDPGTYTFQVKASDNDGSWIDEEASLVIHILPPWWKTWWFRTIGIVLVLGSVIAFYKIRVNSIKLHNKKLEHLVAKRTEQLQQTYEELVHRDEEIMAQNNELYSQREALASRNEDLQLARQTIEEQNREIRCRNETLEEEVRVRTKELVEYNQQLEQFAFISAHNLRAPVARILGLGNILELVKSEPEEERKIVDKLVFATRELDTVVRDLTTILVIKKDNVSVLSDVSLADESKLVKVNLEKEIDETEASIQEDFSTAPIIHTVKPYLDSILINLVSNAIKYRHPGRHPVIQIKSQVIEDYICLMVRDNGLGINLDLYKGKMFTLYSRFHSHVEGKGMGLYLVKTQVAALGGRIDVESEMDRGTTFKIFFRRHPHRG